MKLWMTLLALVLLPTAVFAGEEDLYAPVPPADSAFVRAVNLTGKADQAIQIDSSKFPASSESMVSDYIIVKQGKHDVVFGDHKQTADIEAKQYYTIAANADGSIKVLKDALVENPAKAMIYFYNFSTAADAALASPSHKATVFEKIAPLNAAYRDINAVNLDLAVKADGKDVTTLEKVELKRQMATSVFLTGAEGSYKAFTLQNKVAQ